MTAGLPHAPGKVFGIGFSKTGTSTLGKCFDILGLAPVAHPQTLEDLLRDDDFRQDLRRRDVPPMGAQLGDDGDRADRLASEPFGAIFDEVFDNRNHALALEVAKRFRSFHDRPWSVGPLYQTLDAAFPDSRFILTWRDPEAWWRSVERWLTITHADASDKLRRYLRLLGSDRVDKDSFIAGYLRHNTTIRSYFGDRRDFLDVNFEREPEWAALCAFLDLPVPDCPFPHENRQQT